MRRRRGNTEISGNRLPALQFAFAGVGLLLGTILFWRHNASRPALALMPDLAGPGAAPEATRDIPGFRAPSPAAGLQSILRFPVIPANSSGLPVVQQIIGLGPKLRWPARPRQKRRKLLRRPPLRPV